MQVKVFEAEDMRSALEKVKAALGPEALILSTRNIAGNKFGFSAKSRIEVTAAVDGDGERPSKGAESSQGQGMKRRSRPAGNSGRSTNGSFFETVLDDTQPTARDRGAKEPAADDLYAELRQMRQSFQGLAQEFAEVKGKWHKQWQPTSFADFGQNVDKGAAGSRDLSELHDLGIGAQALQVFAEAMDKQSAAEPTDSADLDPEDFLAHLIAETMELADPLPRCLNERRRLAFIGPTGVGKTTTIAKVAANYMLAGGGKVVLATIDNYRIAAVEQLKIYGRIMNLPVEVARSPEQLREIFERHREADLILVDTAGRSPMDDMRQEELAAFLPPDLPVENHLVLSATTREGDNYTVIDRFAHLKLHGLVLTKLDECALLGQIANIGIQGGVPLSFLTNGQKVPEDLLAPDPRQIAKMILKRNEVAGTWNFKETETRPEHCVH